MSQHTIIFPPPLKKGGTIAVVATSAGIPETLHARLDLCLLNLKNQGFSIMEGPNLRNLNKLQSASPKERAEAFMQFWRNPEVDLILPPWGGNLIITMLDHIVFDELARYPAKWIMGFSDTSTLTFPLTLKTGVATAHGPSLMHMAPGQTGKLFHQWLDVLSALPGKSVVQESSKFHTRQTSDWELNAQETWDLTQPTKWKILGNNKEIEVSGRLIGGCLDTLCAFVGTGYDLFNDFKKNQDKDGTILFLENCELSAAQASRELWNMREAGWFKGLKAILLGRSTGLPQEDYCWEDAITDTLGRLNFPVIYDVDIGHSPPQMTLVNGSKCELKVNVKGQGKMKMQFD